MNHFSEINFLPPQLLGSQSHLCWVCRFAPIHQKRRYKSCCMLKYTTFTHLPNTFQHPQYVPFFSSRVDWLLSYYIVNLFLPSIHVLPCHAVYFYYYNYNYYYYIFYFTMSLTTSLPEVFVVSNAATIYWLLSCVSIHLTTLHFPCCCSVISSIFIVNFFCFLDLYTKFLLLKAMPCLMIAFSLLAFTNYHLCMLEEKKDARTKRNKSADWLICYSKEDRKLKKYIFLLLQQPISKCSSSQF